LRSRGRILSGARTNRALRDLSELRLYRSEDDGVMPPKPALLVEGKIAGYREIAVIDLAAPAPAVVQGSVVRFVDRDGLRVGAAVHVRHRLPGLAGTRQHALQSFRDRLRHAPRRPGHTDGHGRRR